MTQTKKIENTDPNRVAVATYYPDDQRGRVVTNGTELWTDCDSLDDLVARYTSDRMTDVDYE